jgi:hypothetical protein
LDSDCPVGGYSDFIEDQEVQIMTVTAQLIVSNGDQRFAIELTSQALCATVAKLPGNASQNGLFDLLSKHPDSQVRLAVAGMENLPNEAVERLAADSSLMVVLQVLKSQTARQSLNSSQVHTLALRDPEVAALVAATLEDFNLDGDAVLAYLENHPDSHVRGKLAGNPFIGNAVLRRIATGDQDARVREIAADMLV